MAETTAAMTSASNPRQAARRFPRWIGTATAAPLAWKRWADLDMTIAWFPLIVAFSLAA
jgi:hypothetical protein